MFNNDQSGLTFWTPNINIFRDPRWGRGQESPGEDPYLTSEYVLAYVPALEYDDEYDKSGDKTLKVSACCKHFAAYSVEDSRDYFDAKISDIDFADTYLPQFEACAGKKGAKASSIMCKLKYVFV